MELVLLLLFGVTVAAGLVLLWYKLLQVHAGPSALRVIKAVSRKLKRSSKRSYRVFRVLDEAIRDLCDADYSLLRLTGRLLQTWEIQLTKEADAKEFSKFSQPLRDIHYALKSGNTDGLNSACSVLIDEVLASERSKSDVNWQREITALLKAISRALSEGDRGLWREKTNHLAESIPSLPPDLRPAIYLLVGYLFTPLKHTEVCIDQDEMRKQSEALKMLVDAMSLLLSGESYASAELIEELGRYEQKYNPPTRPVGRSTP